MEKLLRPAFNHVWLIDDDQLVNYINEITLMKMGVAQHIRCFTLAEKALNELERIFKTDGPYPDVIFLDMHLPELDARGFITQLYDRLGKEIKELEGKFKLYILSSSEELDDINYFLQKKLVTGFLPKPLIDNDLTTI